MITPARDRTKLFTTVAAFCLAMVCTSTSLVAQTPATDKPRTVIKKSGDISAAWANDGGDKITQDELRATENAQAVHNSVWDGTTIRVFGAQNESVSFNLILEAANTAANNVTVALSPLNGPNGAVIESQPTSGDGVFNWTQRPVELFYVRYLKIEGLSLLSYNPWYDERHVPERMRRPWSGNGLGSGTWGNRPDHDKYYPDIAVPLELVGSFDIAADSNQSIWVDIAIPNDASPGMYSATVSILEGGQNERVIPVELEVYDFNLPNDPTLKTMLAIGYTEINRRYIGVEWACTPSDIATSRLVRDRHFQVAHRHRLSVVDRDLGCSVWPYDSPRPEWIPRLNGSLFTPASGYAGPGEGVGNGMYSIGLWGTWPWQTQGEPSMWLHTDAWENWFRANSPETSRSLYLADESSNFAQLEQWSDWMNNNPGPGADLPSMATIQILFADAYVPSLDIPTSARGLGPANMWQNAVNKYLNVLDKEFWFYNGYRPQSGSFATEDDGVALRSVAWHQYKKEIDRWFFWEATTYNNPYSGGQTNVFQKAQTFGTYNQNHPIMGKTGQNYGNGDGVLMYPGTDRVYPEDSYGVAGPFASLRMKHWRRGLQDGEYLALASEIDPAAVEDIVNAMVPKALWEYNVNDVSQTGQIRADRVFTDISWSTDPDVWEQARRALANIIVDK